MTRGVISALLAAAVLAAQPAAGARPEHHVFGYDAWRAEVARRGLNPDEVVYPFEVSDEMLAWAREATADVSSKRRVHVLKALQDAFFEEGGFEFSYDEDSTLTAADAFASRRGNCMSFTALFVAMSRGMGISTFLVEVSREPAIEREDTLIVVNRHVVAAIRSGNLYAIFDFSKSSESSFVARHVVDDVRASAMHHNNLGALALRRDDTATALKHLAIAAVLAPDWAPAWVNLGVVRANGDDLEGALEAYRRALDVDPDNSSAFNNLSILYTRQGREAEAKVALEAAVRGGNNPFTLVALADSEMLRGNHRAAARQLGRAKRRFPEEPEVWQGLARLAHRTGHEGRGERYAGKAAELREAETKD